jgi:hypothetical protein
MVALVLVSLVASAPLSGRRLASSANWSADEAPTSSAVAAASSYATTGTGLAMAAGFAYLFATSEFAPPLGSSIVGLSSALLLLNFGPCVGDLLNGDLLRFGTHGGLRLLLFAVSVVVRYAWIGWVAAVVIDLRDAHEAPARWAQRQEVIDRSASAIGNSPARSEISLAF